MNTKFSFTLLAVLIVLSVSLAMTTSFTKSTKSVDLSQPARPVNIPSSRISDYPDYFQRHPELRRDNDFSDYYQRHPTLRSAAESAREAQASRLWSGEVFLSDNGAPDAKLNTNVQSACMSVDNQPQRHGGCAE